jgi:hypothetical protein
MAECERQLSVTAGGSLGQGTSCLVCSYFGSNRFSGVFPLFKISARCVVIAWRLSCVRGFGERRIIRI